jgi:hypothetical protein
MGQMMMLLRMNLAQLWPEDLLEQMAEVSVVETLRERSCVAVYFLQQRLYHVDLVLGQSWV